MVRRTTGSAGLSGGPNGCRGDCRNPSRVVLDDAELYNTIKHRLGLSAGNAVFLMDSTAMSSGLSVEFPVPSDLADGARTWSMTTRWIDLTESLGLARVAINMIEATAGGRPDGRRRR